MNQPNKQSGLLSVAKYSRPTPTVHYSSWVVSGEWMRYHFGPHVAGANEISLSEAVAELDKTTSCGYPWNLIYPTKQRFLQSPASGVLDYYWEDLINSQEYTPIWNVSQKRELRAKEKIAQNKIRTFTAAPIEHTSSLSRLCLDFNRRFYRSANTTWSFVGGTPFYQGWHQLFTTLNVYARAFDLDVKDFDSVVFAQSLREICDFRCESFSHLSRTPDNVRRMHKLYDEIIHSLMILESGELIQKHSGNPSGHANTIVDNTLHLYRLFAYCWLLLAPPHLATYESFMTLWIARLNGDDNACTISDDISSWWHPVAIKEAAATVGTTITTDHDEPRKLSEISFLSSDFVRIGGLWLPAPETDKVLSSLAWGSKIDDVRWHYLRACALLVSAWPNIECRNVINSYLNYLSANHRHQLIGEVEGMQMREVFALRKTDLWCWNVYAGYEGFQEGKELSPLKIKTINLFDRILNPPL